MLAKYEFNRKAVDAYLKSIHPIYKKHKWNCQLALDGRVSESPVRTVHEMLSTYRATSPSTLTRLHTSEVNHKAKSNTRAASPLPKLVKLLNLTGSPLNLTKRNITPLRLKTKGTRFVTKLPYVKWVI